MQIRIHMKSGKTLVETGVSDYTIRYTDEQITYISIELSWWRRCRTIIIGSIDLKSIEAITIH